MCIFMTDLQQKIEEARKKAEQKQQAAAAAMENLKKLEARQKANERKAREHQFIQFGSAIEFVIGAPLSSEKKEEILDLVKIPYAYEMLTVLKNLLGRDFTERDPARLLDFLQKQENNGQYFTNAMSK